MKNKRDITIKVIHKEAIIDRELSKYFAKKYFDKDNKALKESG